MKGGMGHKLVRKQAASVAGRKSQWVVTGHGAFLVPCDCESETGCGKCQSQEESTSTTLNVQLLAAAAAEQSGRPERAEEFAQTSATYQVVPPAAPNVEDHFGDTTFHDQTPTREQAAQMPDQELQRGPHTYEPGLNPGGTVQYDVLLGPDASPQPPKVTQQTSPSQGLEQQSFARRTPNRCWGSVISHHTTACTPGFIEGSGHFRNKFCPACVATGLNIEGGRARLLPADAGRYTNPSSHGCWAEVEVDVSGVGGGDCGGSRRSSSSAWSTRRSSARECRSSLWAQGWNRPPL